MKNIAQAIEKMAVYSKGDLRDVNHFMKVWGYAKVIGELEGLDAETQLTLELAAVVHDIACPLCREKYGNTSGKLQELEGPLLAAAFLEDMGVDEAQIQRIAFLVGHHHTYSDVDGPDYQILLEADYIVNAAENCCPIDKIRAARSGIFRTESGTKLLESIYNL